MPLKLTAPLLKTFELSRADEKYGTDGTPTTVTVRQATQFEHERRQALFATLEQKMSNADPDEFSLVQNWSLEELKRVEVWLTFVDCNMLDEKGNPLFPSREGKAPVNEKAFTHAWGSLFPDIAAEIHEKILEVNPLWRGQSGEGL
jgi:hypothetical protein